MRSNFCHPFRYKKTPESLDFPGFCKPFDIVWAVDYRLLNWEGLILLGSWNVVLQTRYKRRTTHYSSEHLWIIKEGDGLNKYVSPSFLSQHHSIPVVFENVYVLFWYIHLFLNNLQMRFQNFYSKISIIACSTWCSFILSMIICIFSISNSIFVSPSFGTIPNFWNTNPVNVSQSSAVNVRVQFPPNPKKAP